MKVLLVNGSPHLEGCTYTALTHVAKSLEENGIETEIFQLGMTPVHGCFGCGACRKLGACIYADDACNELIEKFDEIDGIVVGSPVYYAGPNGALCALLDRAFYAGSAKLRFKVGAAVCSARRAGTTATLDRLHKYFSINNMPVATSCYWPMVHGSNGAVDVEQDEEGVAVMEQLGANMAWLMKCIAAGKEAGIEPVAKPKPATNFIR